MVINLIELSHPRYQKDNFSFIISILLINGYPTNFIFRTISRRLKFLLSNSNANSTYPSQFSSSSIPFFTIPFSKNVFTEFITLIKNYTNIRLAFTVNNKLNSFIKLHKNPVSILHPSNVIYKISCLNCEASYVDQTKRKLIIRIEEHRFNDKKLLVHYWLCPFID